MLGVDPREVNVPVVGGHAGVTILPLLSQVVESPYLSVYPYICIYISLSVSIIHSISLSPWLSRHLNLKICLRGCFMQVQPSSSFTAEEVRYLTDRIQNGGTEVVEVRVIIFSCSLDIKTGAQSLLNIISVM